MVMYDIEYSNGPLSSVSEHFPIFIINYYNFVSRFDGTIFRISIETWQIEIIYWQNDIYEETKKENQQ